MSLLAHDPLLSPLYLDLPMDMPTSFLYRLFLNTPNVPNTISMTVNIPSAPAPNRMNLPNLNLALNLVQIVGGGVISGSLSVNLETSLLLSCIAPNGWMVVLGSWLPSTVDEAVVVGSDMRYLQSRNNKEKKKKQKIGSCCNNNRMLLESLDSPNSNRSFPFIKFVRPRYKFIAMLHSKWTLFLSVYKTKPMMDQERVHHSVVFSAQAKDLERMGWLSKHNLSLYNF